MNVAQLPQDQRQIRQRLLKMIYGEGLSHLGSCLSVIDIIDAIYDVKQRDERFVLSNGHAGLALYAVLEKHQLLPVDTYKKLHLHPDRNAEFHIDASSGSLGQGLPIALGMALARREREVYCVISDGECAEGSIWESLRIGVEQRVNNLKIVVNANGWAAYTAVDVGVLEKRLLGFGYELIVVDGHDKRQLTNVLSQTFKVPTIVFAKTNVEQLPFLQGLDAHYYVMSAKDFNIALELCQ